MIRVTVEQFHVLGSHIAIEELFVCMSERIIK